MQERFKNFVLFSKLSDTNHMDTYRAIIPRAQPFHEQVDLFKAHLSSNTKFNEIYSDHIAKIQSDEDLSSILKIKEYGKDSGHFYIVREYRKSKSLREIITESNEQYFPVSIEHAVYIMRQLNSFFQYISSDIDKTPLCYYLDPEDLRVSFDGELFFENIYLVEAIMEASDSDIKSFGTSVSYFAPEYIQNKEKRPNSTIFSLGAIFYEILTGKRLMPDNPGDYKKALPGFKYPDANDFEEEPDPQLLNILNKMIQINPDQRYSTFDDLNNALEDFMEEGNFSPTTFHFVYFLETLFRDFVDEHPKILQKEIEKAKLLELEAIRESEEEMLKQKVEETSKESKFPIIPVVVVVIFVAMIIVGLTMHRPWKDEAAATLREQREQRERLTLDEQRDLPGVTDIPHEPVPEVPEPAPEPEPEPAPPEIEAPAQEEIERQRRLEQERLARLEQERLEQELAEQERIEREQQEQDRREQEARRERIAGLLAQAGELIEQQKLSEARTAIASLLEIDPANERAEELSMEIDQVERRLRRQERAELLAIPINEYEADTPPRLVTPPVIDLRAVENRIPRDVLRDLKSRVNRITCRLLVSEDGDVESVEEIIVQRAVYGTFERTGLLAEIERQVSAAKYTPAIKDGMRRKCYVTLSFPWR